MKAFSTLNVSVWWILIFPLLPFLAFFISIHLSALTITLMATLITAVASALAALGANRSANENKKAAQSQLLKSILDEGRFRGRPTHLQICMRRHQARDWGTGLELSGFDYRRQCITDI